MRVVVVTGGAYSFGCHLRASALLSETLVPIGARVELQLLLGEALMLPVIWSKLLIWHLVLLVDRALPGGHYVILLL